MNGSLIEAELNLDVSDLLRQRLVGHDATVWMTRTDNFTTLSTRERYEFCNSKATDIAVSVHHNGWTDPAVNYSLVIYFHGDDRVLGQAMIDEFFPALGTSAGNLRNAFGFVLKTNMPAVVLEPVFMTNDQEAPALSVICQVGGGCRRDEIAQAIFAGIESYFESADGGAGPGPGNGKGKPPR